MNPSEKKLTVCMIAKNEEANLVRALESVRGLADEVIVVDTGSTDGTRSKARSLGAAVIDHEWNDDFADAKNVALDNATGEYVLFLDADEHVSPESKDKVLSAIAKGADAYFVRIESNVRSGAGRKYVNLLQRLFKNNKAVRYEGAVHEKIDASLKRIGAKVEASEIVIVHSGYGLGPCEMRKKLERNLRILKRMLVENPEDAVSLFHLGETLSMLGDHEEAIAAYEKSLAVRGLPHEVRPVAIQNLASSMIKVGKHEDALRLLPRVRELDPALLSAHLLMGSALFGLKKFERAEQEILTYISRARAAHKSADRLLGFEVDIPAAMVLIAKCRLAAGDMEKASEVLKDAVALDGDFADGHILLGKIAFEKMDFTRAAPRFERAIELMPHEERLYFELARSYMAAGAADRALQTIETALARGLESAGLLRCLGLLRVKRKDFDGAVSAYSQALEIEPDDPDARRMLVGLHRKLGNDAAAAEYLTICK